MNKWIEEFKRLYSKDKAAFILHCLKLSLIFLFLIGIVMPFAVSSQLINGRVSMGQLPLSVLYILPQVIFLFSYILSVLDKRIKLANILFKVSTIIGSITVIWGLIMFYVGFSPNGADLGTGMMFMILFNVIMWYLLIKENKVLDLISKNTKDVATSTPESIQSSNKKEGN